MSDESQPQPLRLKPRLRPESEKSETPAAPEASPQAPQPAAPENPSPAANAGEAPAKLRLKPRLPESNTPAERADETPEAPAETAPASVPTPAVELPPGEPAPGAAEAAPEEAEPEAVSRFKLKPRVPEQEPAAQETPLATETPAEATPAPSAAKQMPPFLVMPSTPSETRTASKPPFVVSAPKVPHIKGPDSEDALARIESEIAAPPVERKGFKLGVAFTATVLLLILLVAGFAAWKVIFAPPPAVEKPSQKAAVIRPAATPAARPAGKPTAPQTGAQTTAAATTQPAASSATVPAITSLEQAREMIDQNRRNEQARVDALAQGRDPDAAVAALNKPASPPSPPIPSPQAAATVQPQQAPSQQPPPPPPPSVTRVAAAPEASPAFKRFVADASIPGVFQGKPPRALVNGRLVEAGEIADRQLGIIFVGIDAEQKTITFRDATGATVTRKY